MNGVNNATNAKNAQMKSSSTAVNGAQPQPPSTTSGNNPKAITSANNSPLHEPARTTNGDASTSTSSKSRKTTPAAIDPSEVHELVQSRIAALEGEKVQGGEDDKRSGKSFKDNISGEIA